MIKLSASKINSYMSCSYRAWCNYHLNFPRVGSNATKLGSIVHELLELLVINKHRKIYDLIREAKSIKKSKVVSRLICLKLKKEYIYSDETFDKVDLAITVAIKNDLIRTGSKSLLIEMPFRIECKGFLIQGFCDQVVIYDDYIKIVDFKTGKKPTGAAKDDYLNVQGLIYEWAITKMFPGKRVEVEFHYLHYKNASVIKYGNSSPNLLNGLEHWMEHISNYISNFTYKDAISNMAYSNGGKFNLCGKCLGDKTKNGLDAFICEMKYPRRYFIAKEGDKVVNSSFYKNELLQKNQNCIIEERTHQGCPAWKFLWEK